MSTRRWVRFAAVTALAVGATLVATAGAAQALPRNCNAFQDAIDYDWDQVNNYAAWALIAQHDGDWQDFVEDQHDIAFWAMQAKIDTSRAQKAGC